MEHWSGMREMYVYVSGVISEHLFFPLISSQVSIFLTWFCFSMQVWNYSTTVLFPQCAVSNLNHFACDDYAAENHKLFKRITYNLRNWKFQTTWQTLNPTKCQNTASSIKLYVATNFASEHCHKLHLLKFLPTWFTSASCNNDDDLYVSSQFVFVFNQHKCWHRFFYDTYLHNCCTLKF